MSRITTLLLVFCLILSGCGNHKSRNNQVTLEPDSLSGPHSHAQELFDKARKAADRSGGPEAFLRVDNLSVYYALQCKEYEKAAVLLDSMQVRMSDHSQNSFYHEFYDNYTCILAVSKTKGQDGRTITSARRLIGELKDKPLNNLSVLTYRLLGDVLAEVGETALSIEAYQACYDYIEKNQLVNQQRLVYYALGKLYAETMRPAESSRYLLMAHQANQQFTERRNAGLISQFRVKYETREWVLLFCFG